MTDHEKVISGLEYCNRMKLDAKCDECPYNGDRKELPDCLDDCGILDDVISLMRSMEADADIMAQCRAGTVVKHVGRGIVVLNYDWWMKILKKKPDFQPVPDLEDLVNRKDPTKPVSVGNDEYVCEKCEEIVGWEEFAEAGIDPVRFKYCPGCGRKVKWE